MKARSSQHAPGSLLRLAAPAVFAMIYLAGAAGAFDGEQRTKPTAGAQASDTTTEPRKATIELRDGTRIVGVVKEIKDGTYTIESESAGEMAVAEAEVRKVEYGVKKTIEQPRQDYAGDVATLQEQIVSNPDLMNSVLTDFATDPAFLELLEDKELMKDIENMNLLKLLTNPKLQKLADQDNVGRLTEKLLSGDTGGDTAGGTGEGGTGAGGTGEGGTTEKK
ncbi:MAG: hypothetical protein QGF67_01525 [Lentisphaeria bacterium]|nr:hypothetical protein [Lentisphaeria bacterium]